MALGDSRIGWVQSNAGLGFPDPGVRVDCEREGQGVFELVPELIGGCILLAKLLFQPPPAYGGWLLKHMKPVTQPNVHVERR